jgi:hypothetical protein
MFALFTRIGAAVPEVAGTLPEPPEGHFSGVFRDFSGFEGCIFASVVFNHPVADCAPQN